MKSLITKITIFLAIFSLATPALATIQDQARANRESFLRLHQEPKAEVPGNATSTEARLKSLDNRVNEIKEQAILVNYNRIIAKLAVYITYLDSINSRIDNKIAEESLEISEKEALALVLSAKSDLEQASSTIVLAKASSTEIFLGENPAEALGIMKERLATTSSLLQSAREKITSAIDNLKN